ncbi:MAG: hypothetical protein JST22_00315 [Bacteroidetes bacterium]|nr:hypothetical protein [Bacteroidota bacterium]
MISQQTLGLRLLLPILLLVAAAPLAHAQGEYEWTLYSALNATQAVAFDTAGTFWVATTGGVVAYHSGDRSFQVFHTTDQIYPEKQGLLALNSTAIAFDPSNNDMYVGSDEGLVSIRKGDGRAWRYSAEIASMSERPSRRINGFGFHNRHVYFLCDFGIGVYNPDGNSFIESYLRFGTIPQNTPVHAILFWSDRIWVGTDGGLVSAPLSSPNLAAPDSWTMYPGMATGAVYSLAVLRDSMIIGTDSGATMIGADGGFARRGDLPLVKTYVTANGNQVSAASEIAIYLYNGSTFTLASGVPDIITSTVIGRDGSIAVGLRNLGFGLFANQTLTTLQPNAPALNQFTDLIRTDDGSIWAASSSGGSSASAGLSRLKSEWWQDYSSANLAAFKGDNGQPNNAVWNVGNGPNGQVWAGTYGIGMIVLNPTPDTVVDATRYFEGNSPLRGLPIDPTYVVTCKAVADANSRTWFTNFDPTSANGPVLLVKLRNDEQSADGTGFVGFVCPYNIPRAFRWLAIDDYGTKWMGPDAVNNAPGLLYMNDGGNPSDPSSAKWGILTTSDGLLSNQQTALVSDKLGELWIGTPSGLTVLVNPGSVVASHATPVFRSIRFFTDIYVYAVAVDALNRKWVGTDQGIFLLNAEGDQVLTKFTTDNSPLVNNQIRSILAVDATGDIYIGTKNGMNRVRTIAVEPSTGDGQLALSPHPFRIPSAEPLRIKGLPSDATVKIFGPGMTLVREFPAPGGAVALWDGRDASGNDVPSGVYIIAAGAGSGDVVAVGKVAVIRQ